MSQDTGLPGNSGTQEVDLDEIEVEVLILAKNVNPLQQAASFLTRRGWPTTVLGNLQKAIEHIAEKRPDFVLISVNHPHPTVAKLPDIISQAFNLTCVAFTESSDTASNNKLGNFKSKYKISGLPSGPNVHRSLRKILAEKLNIHLDEKGAPVAAGKAAASDNDVVDDSTEYSDDGQVSGNQMVRGSGNTAGKSKTMVQKSGIGASGEGGIAYHGQAGGDSQNGSSQGGGGQNGPAYNGQSPENKSRSGKSLKSLTRAGATGAQGAGGEADSPTSEKDPDIIDGSVISSGKYTMQTPRTRKSLKSLAAAGAPAPAAGEAGDTDAAKEAAALLGKVKESLFGDKAREPVLERAQVTLKQAMQQAFAKVSGGKEIKEGETPAAVLKLEKQTRIGVFPVDSSSAPGYLTVALQIEPGGATDVFLKSLETVLRDSFQQQGFDGKLEDGFWLNVPEVDFQLWAKEMSLFHFNFAHAESEVVAAFFKLDQPLPKLRGTSQPDMFAVSLETIAPDRPVNFKAYLYLEKNRKFFLYLRQGRSLAEKQKEHLLGNEVKDICLKGADVQNLRMFLAANYLKDMIGTLAA